MSTDNQEPQQASLQEMVEFYRNNIFGVHFKDEQGNVTGGTSTAIGIEIDWQDGALKENGEPNGAFVENVIRAVIDRIEVYQNGPLACVPNDRAISFLKQALTALGERREDRISRGVQDTYKP